MLQEVIVVEGKNDAQAVKRAVEAQVLVTQGWQLSPNTLANLRGAYERRGLIILTDPDGPGERIRARLAALFPQAGHAYIPKEAARGEGDVGVENASPASIRTALARARHYQEGAGPAFTMEDLFRWGLNGASQAAARRAALGAALGLGYGSAKHLLTWLNAYGLSRAEVEEAVAELSKLSWNGA